MIPSTLRSAVVPGALALVLLQGCGGSDDDPVAPAGGGAGAGDAPSVPGPGSPPVTGTEGTEPGDGVVTDTTGGADADAETPAPSGDFAALAGLYDASYDEDGVTDVIYIEIAPDGRYTEYDYDGDDYDQGDNCYFIASGRLESVGGDVYRLVDGGFDESEEGTLVRSGDALRVSYVDTFDEDGDGDVTETLTETWPVITNLSSTDLNACVVPPIG